VSIRRGQNWGAPGRPAAATPVVASDAAVGDRLERLVDWDQRIVVGEMPSFVLTGGDLHRTLGAPRRRGTPEELLAEFTCDVMVLSARDPAGTEIGAVAVAHVVGVQPTALRRRPPLWSTPSLVVANAAFVLGDNLAPRAHPGDGWIDVTSGMLHRRDRGRAAIRARTGTHVPHPDLTERRVREWKADPRVTYLLAVDGRSIGRVSDLRVTVVPDAIQVFV